jgi:hypothetical protein
MKQKKLTFKSISVKMLMIIFAILMAFTSCGGNNNGNGNDDNGNGNGNNGGGGVAGKRIKEFLQTTSSGTVKSVYNYNNDGSIKQIDLYNGTVRITYNVYTNHSDGRPESYETFYEGVETKGMKGVTQLSYDSNKTLQKMESILYMNGVEITKITIDYTFQNGRKTRELQISSGGLAQTERVYEYDSQGKRTKTTETTSAGGIINQTVIYTRSYNSDGTLDKVTYTNPMDNTPSTISFTWENGNKIMDEDIYYAY